MLKNFPNLKKVKNFTKLFKNHRFSYENEFIYLDHYCIIDQFKPTLIQNNIYVPVCLVLQTTHQLERLMPSCLMGQSP